MNNEILTFSAPMRLSLAGGGSDLPESYLKADTKVMSVSINERVTIKVGKNIENTSSQLVEIFQQKHPYCNVQVSSNIPPGSGLGGSGSLAVALVAADNYLNTGRIGDPLKIGLEAYRWEREILGQSVGFQDQLVAAIGSCVQMDAFTSGKINAFRRDDLYSILCKFMENNFVFIEVGKHRKADDILKQLASSYESNKQFRPASFNDIESAINHKDVEKFGIYLRNHWNSKRSQLPASTSMDIDFIIDNALDVGAIGAKNIGAGGGGYVFICTKSQNKQSVINRMVSLGYNVCDFKLSSVGVIKE